jgi:hypothetical protein
MALGFCFLRHGKPKTKSVYVCVAAHGVEILGGLIIGVV